MLLKNISILYGKDLKYVPSASIQITNQKFGKMTSSVSGGKAVDCEGLLLVPGFVNMHTHIGDSIAKDAVLSGTVDSKIHPIFGAKQRILKNSMPEHLASFMKNTCYSMLKKGITTFVDFREGGLEGVHLIKKALSTVPIRSVVLGRLEYYQDKDQIRKNTPLRTNDKKTLTKILRHCDGLGVSGANENSDSVLQYYSKTGKIRAIHSSETTQSVRVSKMVTGRSETERALAIKPHFLVHMTFASNSDLALAAKKTHGIVICPRANAALAEGIPDFMKMRNAGCTVAIGTDNVMINSPDMLKEMDYLWKVTMGTHRTGVDPKEILKMATVNGGIILGKKIGSVEEGYLADGFFIDKHAVDLEPIHNPHASLVHRVTEHAIRAVMIGGRIVHGKI
ncbi:amidohydrolase family protein [Candidatus Nitrosotenuis uzonensis]|uniref:Amidohydrolase n=1 Tax=Candidatus Nitrosotenuis uzonensis TaxID=1407055 RepID=A0A812F3X6_9ARCH|nr:amidohydrolase family protein [Candidatus Nitrosotenuis uzonensis]CAE6492730.1 Amidohydrolase [Candidatus Nitrosotenuis uzonensis]